ncbi:putative Transcriptional regulator,sugar-binding [Nostocoides japonicum T1-X7]|uniref:Putative Transcriptional regulator,sugar-binding n=1 Tax=Nostocoides japonicum T1-X7 TaxID=1194083 RepID=A0A077LX31_9MICO|nr:putative Transcriptional regulator,sugar-binding [Tetrasphaera japonica T1-X7]
MTLRDVADAAGVSVSTASLVFSGKGPVSEATAVRVRGAAETLGYAGPDPLASSLRQGRAGVIGVVVEGRLLHAFRDPFAVSVLDGLAQVLDTIPAGMLLLAQDPEDYDKTVGQLAGLALDAVVFALCGPRVNPVVDLLAVRGVPMVGAGSPADPRVVRVTVDEEGATAVATRHLLDLGHRRLGMVAMPLSPGTPGGTVDDARVAAATYPDALGRVLGFRQTAPAGSPIVEAVEPDVDHGRVAGGALLDLPAGVRPTGVVAQSDLLAAGVIRAAEERGLRVPQDVSVVGFDGIALPWLPGTLTTIEQEGQAKGRRLGELAAGALRGEPVHDVVHPTRLRVGTTTAPPPR